MHASPARRLFPFLFWALVVLSLVPLWAFRFFPSQDGPSHLYNAWLLLHLHDPALPQIAHYYTLNTMPSPNWITHLLLAGLMMVVQPLVAEKVLLSVYLVALPLSARYAIASLRPSAAPLSLLVFPLAYNYFLHMGFYNFVFCLPLFLVTLGYYLRHGHRLTPGRTAALSGLALLLYFAHLSGLVMVIFAIGLHWPFGVVFRKARSGATPLRTFVSIFIAFLPSVILTAIFLLRAPQADVNANISEKMSLMDRLMFYPFSLVAYAKPDRIYSAAFLAALLGIAVFALRPRRAVRRDWSLPLITLAAVLLSFVVPNNISQGGFVFHRVVLFAMLLGILALAAMRWRPLAMLAIQLVATALTVAGYLLNAGHYRVVNQYLSELSTLGPRINSNHTLLYTESNLIPQTASGGVIAYPVNPFLHAGCYLALDRGLVEIDNYEAIVGYFPVLFQSQLDPPSQRPLPNHNSDTLPPRITFPPTVPGTVDYVVFFTGGASIGPTDRNNALQRQFETSFTAAGDSTPPSQSIEFNPVARLYQAKGNP